MQTRKGYRNGVCPLISVGVSCLLRGEHTAQRRTEPPDHGKGAGQTDLVVDVLCSTDPLVDEGRVSGPAKTSLVPGLVSLGQCRGWMCCRR